MNASFVDFRKKSAQIIAALDRNETVTVLYRGKPKALMMPIARAKKRAKAADLPAFGMWRDREDMRDVDAYVRKLRRGRFRDLR
jgi:antitoxin (DNA-binding transcriptional repressor) of toxin-antitoxin stability system